MSDQISSLSHEELVALVIQLQQEIERLKAENQSLKELLAKATKNSTNSSKRPSSDIVKPKKKKKASGKKN